MRCKYINEGMIRIIRVSGESIVSLHEGKRTLSLSLKGPARDYDKDAGTDEYHCETGQK